MSGTRADIPLHGVTLEQIVIILWEHYGWTEPDRRVNIRAALGR